MRNPEDSYCLGDRLSNTLGLLAGPYRFTLAWPVRGFTHATFPGTGSALWHFAKILVPRLRAMPGNTRPGVCALPRAERRSYRRKDLKISACPRSTFIRQYLVTPDVTMGSGAPGMTRTHMHAIVEVRGVEPLS